MDITFTPETLLIIAGAALSLVFSYVPGVAPKFNTLDGTWKRLVMLGLLAAITGIVYGLACANIVSGVSCTQAGFTDLVKTFIMALIANQATDRISPQVGHKK